MKIYYYKYNIILPNSQEKSREFFTTKVEELIEKVRSNNDKWYVIDEEVYSFSDGEKIELDKIINPF